MGSGVSVGSGVFVGAGDGVGVGGSVWVGTGVDVGSCGAVVGMDARASATLAATVAGISAVGAGIWAAARVRIVVGVGVADGLGVDVGVSLIQAMMNRLRRRIASLTSNGAPLPLKDPVSVPSPDPSQGKPTRGHSAESLFWPTSGI